MGGLPCRTQVAALPFRLIGGSCEVMLITSRGTGRWVTPKGWPEGTETYWTTAAREAHEEAGVEGRISQDVLGRFYYAKRLSRGREWRCEVLVYPLQVAKIHADWPERKERKRQWFTPAEAASLVDEPDLAEMIASFVGSPMKASA